MTTIRYKLLADVPAPAYQTAGASGIDLCAAESRVISPGDTVRIETGVSVEIPRGFEGQIRPRSSVSLAGILCHFGTIDSDYRGPIGVVLSNLCIDKHGPEAEVSFRKGDRIAQLVIAPVERVELVRVEQLSETARGGAGFGSTGR